MYTLQILCAKGNNTWYHQMGCKISYTIFPLLNAWTSIVFRGLYRCLLEARCLITSQLLLTHALFTGTDAMYTWHAGMRRQVQWMAITSIYLSERPWSVKNYIQNRRRTTNTMNTLLQWFWTAIQLATYPVQLFQQCKTSTYKAPSYMCGHMECLPCPPHSHIAIRGYLACIGDPTF